MNLDIFVLSDPLFVEKFGYVFSVVSRNFNDHFAYFLVQKDGTVARVHLGIRSILLKNHR